MEEVILDVFPMVALSITQTKGTFLQDRILTIPQRDAKAEKATLITDTQKTILAPAIGAGAGMVMGEGAPGITTGGIVLPHSAPLTITEITAPAHPGHLLFITLGHTPMFRAQSHSWRRRVSE